VIKRWISQQRSYLLGIALGLVIASIVLFWPKLLAFSDAHDGLAAWVQAVGSVLAILWAVMLWRGDVARAKCELDARARIVAFRIAPALFDIEKSLDIAFKALELIGTKVGAEPTDDIIFSIRKTVVFPPLFDASIYDEFHCLPPDLAFRLTYLLYTVGRYNRQIDTLLELAAKNPDQILPKMVANQKPVLEKIKTDVETLLPIFAKEFSYHLSAQDQDGAADPI